MSLPMWERGLKLLNILPLGRPQAVAPHVGAWIETQGIDLREFANASLPMWERGLKQKEVEVEAETEQSLPMWERGLKHNL